MAVTKWLIALGKRGRGGSHDKLVKPVCGELLLRLLWAGGIAHGSEISAGTG
jgi:hypothetical protein